MALTEADILHKVKEAEIRFLYLQITDITGKLKSITIPISQLEKALAGELMFDGSSIEGFVRIEESDMYLRPDLDTFVVLPWRKSGVTEARLICDVYNADGTPFVGCPRCNLKRVVQEAAGLGYQMQVGPEAEFFLFLRDKDGKPTTHTHDQAGYFDLAPDDLGENARRDMVLVLEDMGFEVEASHHEVAPGQHEIDFKYGPAVATADKIATLKYMVRIIAQEHGLHASFMPKPLFGENGSGMHCHQSLFQKEKNIFYDPHTPNQLSREALAYVAGILRHAAGFTAITNPTVNSFKRLVPGYEAPVYVAWSERNRSPLIRIPAKRGMSTRVELRNPDPSCNPYLAFAVMLKAGLTGIQEQLTPPEPVDHNLYEMDPDLRVAQGIHSLPGSLGEALAALEQDPVVQEALGAHIFQRFLAAKYKDWNCYRTQVHPWEIEQYLASY